MKILKGLLFTLLFFLASNVNVKAQDIHFTQFYLSPMTTNPAYTGAFQGTFRIGGIYRDQWGTISTSAYRTPSFYIDAPILMIGKRNWLGVGGMFLNDEAGALSLGQSQAMGSVALHLSMDKKSNNVLTIGIQGGYISRNIDYGQAHFQDAIAAGDPVGTTGDLGGIQGGMALQNMDPNKFDMALGVLLRSQMNKKMRMELGLSLKHLLTPDLGFNTGGNADDRDVPGNFNLHGQFFVDLTDKVVLKPAFIFQSTAGANEIGLQALGGYHLNAEKDMTLNVGLGYRMRDATKFLVGMDYKQFRAGIAYDLTVSDLADAGTPQSFELGVSYIAKIYKKPTVKPVIFCPRF